MDKEEALKWVNGERTTWNELCGLSSDRSLDVVRCAEADAAKAQQAYWTLRAIRELARSVTTNV